jgi:hypothetical protein
MDSTDVLAHVLGPPMAEPMTPLDVKLEANRCPNCYDAPCTRAWPASIDIPRFIRRIADGFLAGSARSIMVANPTGASCARVCPTDELCEGACVYAPDNLPIRIGQLQHATDWLIANGRLLFAPFQVDDETIFRVMHHIPQVAAGPNGCGFWEKFYFKPGNNGYPTFQTKFARIGVYACYDRHFPEGARLLGLNGAEIVFNPSATVAGLAEYLWKLEQPAHAVANGYYVAAINRVGFEEPWNMGEFFGLSYLVDPRGQFVSIGSRDKDEVVIGDMDRRLIDEVRNTWQFYRDRRPETYGDMVAV